MSDDEKRELEEEFRKLTALIEKEMQEQDESFRQFQKSIKILKLMALFYAIALTVSLVLMLLSLFFEGLSIASLIANIVLNSGAAILLICINERNKSKMSDYPFRLKAALWLALLLNMSMVAYNFWELF